VWAGGLTDSGERHTKTFVTKRFVGLMVGVRQPDPDRRGPGLTPQRNSALIAVLRCPGSLPVLPVLALLSIGCQPDAVDQPTDRTAVPFGPEEVAMRYELSDTPRISVGTESGDPSSDFFLVRAAQLLDDGRLVVAEPTRVQVFSAEGDLESSFGGEGQGPGEFRSLLWMQRLAGDTLAFYDGILGRVSWFALDGELLRTTPQSRVIGILQDGRMIVSRSLEPIPPVLGVVRQDIEIDLLSPEGDVERTIGRFPSMELFQVPELMMATNTEKLRRTFYAVRGEHFFLTTADQFEVLRFGPPWTDPPERFREEVQPALLQAEELFEQLHGSGSVPLGATLTRAHLDGFPDDQTLPAITHLRLSPEGLPWVQGTIRDGSDPTREWYRFGPDGRVRAHLTTPSEFRVTQFGEDFVVGVARDELGVERVQVRDMRPQGP